MRIDLISKPYRSIACGAYDVLEASSIRKRSVRLELVEGDILEGLILDVFAKGREEFCRIQPAGSPTARELRLDSIHEITDLVDGTRTLTQVC